MSEDFVLSYEAFFGLILKINYENFLIFTQSENENLNFSLMKTSQSAKIKNKFYENLKFADRSQEISKNGNGLS